VLKHLSPVVAIWQHSLFAQPIVPFHPNFIHPTYCPRWVAAVATQCFIDATLFLFSYERSSGASSNAHQLRTVLLKLLSAGSGRPGSHIEAHNYATTNHIDNTCCLLQAPTNTHIMKRATAIVAFALLASFAGAIHILHLAFLMYLW
jgi:hypothetical protein